MGLQEQHVAFKFAGGVETKMDSKAVPSARLLVLENGVFTRAISIKKRNGYRALDKNIANSASSVSGARRLGARDTELLQFTGDRCYSEQTDADQWQDAGAVVCATGSDRVAVHTGTHQSVPDRAAVNGIAVYAWEDSLGGVWWTATDASSGAVYRAPTQAHASGTRPRCVAVGDALHIYFVVASLVMVLVINTSQPSAAVSASVLIDDIDTTNPAYDAVPTLRDGTPALIAWRENATTNIRLGYVSSGGQLGSPSSGYPSVVRLAASASATSPVAVAAKYVDGADGDRNYVAFCTTTPHGSISTFTGGTLSVAITPVATSVVYTTPVAVTRLALAEASGVVWAAFEETAVQASQRFCVVNSLTGTTAGTERSLLSVGLAARAFQAIDDVFAVFVHDTTYFNTYVTLRLSDFAPAGRHCPAEATGAPERSMLPSVHVVDDVASVTLPYKVRLQSAANDKFSESALRLVTMDFDDDNSHQTAQLGRSLYMAGACPQHYDGRQWYEHGFHFGPEYVAAPALAGGGSLTVSSTYEYVFWYEWTDMQGEIHRGPTSTGTTVITGVGDTQATFALPTLRVTRKSNVRICVARSLPGDTSRLWRVSSLDPTTAGSANGYVASTTTANTVTFLDQMSDANLQLQEELYTTGDILSNDPAALGSLVVAGKNRLFFTDAQAPHVVRFSQRLAAGFGVEIAPELAHDVDPYGGAITGLAIMDDVVYAFKAGMVFAFNGDGPFEDGTTSSGSAASGFSGSQLVTSDVGCSNPSSIVLTAEGLLFQSAKGIYLLDHGRQVSYVGSPVEAYNAQTVRRAIVLPDRSAVLFVTDSGSSLYYDYLFHQWSTFANHEGYDAIVVDGSLYYLRTNDTVFKETPGEYSDNGSRIVLRFETAWLHLYEHLQGWQRFWKLLLLGTWVSPHQLGIQYRTSYQDAWSDASWLDATGDTDSAGWLTGEGCSEIGVDPLTGTSYGDGVFGAGDYGGTADDVYQWRFGIHEDGQAVQFRFEDFEKAGLAGASFELTEMTITGGVKKLDARPFSGSRST